MAVNKRKVLDAARKHAQKGAKQKALKEYNTLLKLDGSDAKLRLEIGDAHRRWGENEEAIGHYTKVADQYVRDGFDARAVAVYKQILNLDPKRYAAYVSLSELYQRMGLEGEAVAALQTAADGYHKEGQKREALELLRKMAQLDPTNTTSRLKVADLLLAEGLEGDAVTEYESIAEELLRQGEAGDAANVFQRLLKVQPDRADILLRLARSAIEMRSPERAETWARRAIEVEESEEALELLCDVYKALENNEGLVDATRRLAKIYRDRGDDDQARTIMQRLPTVDAIGDVPTSDPAASARAPEAAPAPALDASDDALLGDDELLGDDAFLADDGTDVFEFDDEDPLGLSASSPTTDLDAPPVPPAEEPAPAPQALPKGDPEQLLAEASVYLRYGKLDQAIANLRGILAEEPGHRAALDKLGEAQAEKGDSQAAVAMWSQAAERAREEGDAPAFGILIDRIAALDPAVAEAIEPMEAPPEPELDDDGASDATAALSLDGMDLPEGFDDAAAEDVRESAGDELSIDIDLDDDLFAEGEEGDAAAATVEPAAAPAAREESTSATAADSATSALKARDELEEAEFYFEQGMLEEAREAYRRVLEIAPNHPSAMLRMGEIAASIGDDPAAAAALAAEGDGDSTLQDDGLGEDRTVDVAVELDLSEDDDDGLAAGGGVHDDDTETGLDVDTVAAPDDGLQDIDDLVADERRVAQAASAQGAPPRVDVHEDDSFDLAAELSDVLGDDDAGASSDGGIGAGAGTEEQAFSSLFESFKKGVDETLADGDYETRYDLAIAYKEMGLLEDAIEAFQSCVACPVRGLDSLQLLGQCALEVGRAGDAIGHLKQALSVEALDDDRMAGLRFDLGRAYVAAGDYALARTTFEGVGELAPAFPGLQEAIVDLLERSGPQQPVADPGDSSGEVFESFDDLVAEVAAESVAHSAPVEPEPLPEATALEEAPAQPVAGIEAAEAWIEESRSEAPTPEPAAPEPAAGAAGEGAEPGKPSKRKKKISFV